MSTKTCTACNTELTLDQFSKRKASTDGLQPRCKICDQAATAARYAANPEKIKAAKATPAGRYSKYKSSAKVRGLSFELTLEQFTTFWQANCTYCGGAVATIGLDRVDSSLGYQIDNVVPCCTMCNKIKLDHDNNALNDHMLQMLKHQGIV